MSDLFGRRSGEERTNDAFQWNFGARNADHSIIRFLKRRRIGVYLQSHLVTPYSPRRTGCSQSASIVPHEGAQS